MVYVYVYSIDAVLSSAHFSKSPDSSALAELTVQNLLCKFVLSVPQYVSTAEPDAMSHVFILTIK